VCTPLTDVTISRTTWSLRESCHVEPLSRTAIAGWLCTIEQTAPTVSAIFRIGSRRDHISDVVERSSSTEPLRCRPRFVPPDILTVVSGSPARVDCAHCRQHVQRVRFVGGGIAHEYALLTVWNRGRKKECRSWAVNAGTQVDVTTNDAQSTASSRVTPIRKVFA